MSEKPVRSIKISAEEFRAVLKLHADKLQQELSKATQAELLKQGYDPNHGLNTEEIGARIARLDELHKLGKGDWSVEQ